MTPDFAAFKLEPGTLGASKPRNSGTALSEASSSGSAVMTDAMIAMSVATRQHEGDHHVIDALRLERIEEHAREVAAEEAAGVRVVVDAGEDQPKTPMNERVLQAGLRCVAAAGAAAVVHGGAEQAEDRRPTRRR